jgi:hypothetical protein
MVVEENCALQIGCGPSLRHIAVNLKGTFNTLHETAACLRNGGRIVSFSTSVVGTKLER